MRESAVKILSQDWGSLGTMYGACKRRYSTLVLYLVKEEISLKISSGKTHD